SRDMSAKRSHGPTVSVQFQHLIHQPTWNKGSHGKFANIRALPSPPSRLHTGQGDKEPPQTGCASVLPLHLFTRDALGGGSRAGTTYSEVSAFSICTFTRPVRQVFFTHRHSTTRLVLKLAISGIFAGPPLGGFPR